MRDFPNGPGFYPHAPDTSRLAAESAATLATDREAKALAFIREQAGHGGTADETADALSWERYSSRPRLSTLHARGAIVDSGGRRRGVSGRMQAVWVVPEHASCPAQAGEASR